MYKRFIDFLRARIIPRTLYGVHFAPFFYEWLLSDWCFDHTKRNVLYLTTDSIDKELLAKIALSNCVYIYNVSQFLLIREDQTIVHESFEVNSEIVIAADQEYFYVLFRFMPKTTPKAWLDTATGQFFSLNSTFGRLQMRKYVITKKL